MDEIIYLNGKLLNACEAGIPPSDQGFLYGAGLFETMRAYSGKIFLIDRHLERMLSSAKVLGMNNIDAAALEKACKNVITANGLVNARVRLTVSMGSSIMSPETSKQPTVLVQAHSLTPPADEKYKQGYRAKVSGIKRYSISPLVCHKTTNYLECLLARNKANDEGYDESLFLNEQGNLTEGSVSNLFFIYENGTLCTPPLDAGMLPGIIRRFMLELAGELGMEVVEENVCPGNLKDFNEAFITNSLIEIMPLASITDEDGREYSFKGGETANRIRRAYREAVEKTIGEG